MVTAFTSKGWINVLDCSQDLMSFSLHQKSTEQKLQVEFIWCQYQDETEANLEILISMSFHLVEQYTESFLMI